MEMIEKIYYFLLIVLVVCFFISNSFVFLSITDKWAKYTRRILFVVICAAIGGRDNMLEQEAWTNENVLMCATMTVLFILYLFSGFFILGRFLTGLFLK